MDIAKIVATSFSGRVWFLLSALHIGGDNILLCDTQWYTGVLLRASMPTEETVVNDAFTLLYAAL